MDYGLIVLMDVSFPVYKRERQRHGGAAAGMFRIIVRAFRKGIRLSQDARASGEDQRD